MINKLGSLLSQKYADLKDRDKSGFTLIELVVVIAIMAVLALIMVPNLTAYIGKADEAKIMTNMKNLHNSAEMVQQTEGFSINTPADNDDFIEAVVKYSNIKDVQLVGEPEGAELARLVSEDRNGFISEVYTLSRNENTGNITVRYLDKKEAEFIFNGHTFIKDGEIVDEDKGEEDVETPESDPADWYLYDGGTITGYNIAKLKEEFESGNPRVKSESGYSGYMVFNPVIPGINPHSGSIITKIGDYAFKDISDGYQSNSGKVVIPNSVTNIGVGAFDNAYIDEVKLPTNLKAIGGEAFHYSTLSELVIPDSVTSIGEWAFYPNPDVSLNKIKSLKLGSGLKVIGDYAFYGHELSSLVVPDSVTSIGEYAFSENKLTLLTLGSSVKSIGDSAFDRNQLSSLVIPNSVKSIGERAFEGIELSSLVLPDSVESIGDMAFWGAKITRVEVGSGLREVGYSAIDGFPDWEQDDGWEGVWTRPSLSHNFTKQ